MHKFFVKLIDKVLAHSAVKGRLAETGWLQPSKAEGQDELRRLGWAAPRAEPKDGGGPGPQKPK